jgi:hypothetical protein
VVATVSAALPCHVVQPGEHRREVAISSEPDLQRILLVYATGERGERTLARAAEMVRESGAELTVVSLAPQDTSAARCVVGTPAYNEAVRDEAAGELEHAQGCLGPLSPQARFKLLVGGRDRPLAAWAAQEAFDVILLPGRQGFLGRGTRQLARRLRRATRADVRAC